MRKMKKLLVCLFLGGACSSAESADGIVVDRTMAGDTVVLMSSGEPGVTRVDGARVLWQSDDLEQPRSMVRFGDRLLVGDRTRVHLISSSGAEWRTVGRSGEGPGEFRSIAAVGYLAADTLLVYDPQLIRLSYLSREGEYLGSSRMSLAPPFVNPTRTGAPLVPWRSGLLLAYNENVNLHRPVQTALVWHDAAADTAAILGSWDNHQWKEIGPFIAPRELFPARTFIAIGDGGRVAVGNGLDYCITHLTLGAGPPRRICRDRARAQIGRGIRSPDPTLLHEEEQRDLLLALVREQEIGESMPSYDGLLFSEDGQLWVRTVGEELAGIHPHIRFRRPDLVPSHRKWDVFDADGRLTRTIELPSAFDPRVIEQTRAYGFLELPTGEIAIGVAEF
jgi:hypothetical protein